MSDISQMFQDMPDPEDLESLQESDIRSLASETRPTSISREEIKALESNYQPKGAIFPSASHRYVWTRQTIVDPCETCPEECRFPCPRVRSNNEYMISNTL